MFTSKLAESILYIGASKPLVLARAELLRLAGFQVETAENVNQAVAVADQRSFDLILICHTFSPEERAHIAMVLEPWAPQAFIMQLNDSYVSIVPDPPDTFLSLVRSAARQRTVPTPG